MTRYYEYGDRVIRVVTRFKGGRGQLLMTVESGRELSRAEFRRVVVALRAKADELGVTIRRIGGK